MEIGETFCSSCNRRASSGLTCANCYYFRRIVRLSKHFVAIAAEFDLTMSRLSLEVALIHWISQVTKMFLASLISFLDSTEWS